MSFTPVSFYVAIKPKISQFAVSCKDCKIILWWVVLDSN